MMRMCDKCDEVKITGCGCNKPANCGCGTKVDLKCTVYKGVTLDPLHIVEGMNGEEIIEIVNDYLKNLIFELEPEPTILENVGDGFKMYKGFSQSRRHEIKTLLKGEGIIIEDTLNDEILIKIDKTFIEANSKVNIENVGLGEGVFKNFEDDIYKFRRLKSSDSTVSITPSDSNESIDFTVDFPEIDYPIDGAENLGEGVELFKEVSGKKLILRTIESDDFIIAEQASGGIKISSPGGGSTSNDWYLDVSFQRPSNWGTAQNPKEVLVYSSSMSEISTSAYSNGQEVKVANGTLNDPFKSYEEYLLKRIYGAGGTANGIPSKSNPRHEVIVLQILSNLTTSSDIEVRNTVLYIRNKSTLTYSGTRDYAIDYQTIFDALTPGATLLPQYMTNTIRGEGIITRTNGFGLIRNKTDSIKTSNGNLMMLNIIGEGTYGLNIMEGGNDVLYSTLTNESGGVLKNGNGIVKGTTQAPVTPLISIIGNNFQYWNTVINGSRVFIEVKTQVGVECKDVGTVTSSAERLMFQVSNQYIGYQTRLTTSSTGEDLNLVNHFHNPNDGQGKVFYKPYEEFTVFKTVNKGIFRIENLATEANGFIHSGVDSIISLSGNSEFQIITSYNDVGGGSGINLVKYTGPVNGVTIKNSDIYPRYYRLVKGDATNQLGFTFINSRINPNIIAENTPSFEAYTAGTISAIKGKPLMSITDVHSDVTAAVAAGMIKGMLFKTTSGDVQQVNI